MPRTFAKDALLSVKVGSQEYRLSDHNRSELDVSVERIGDSQRMANGTMRSQVIADKRKFSVSWSDLPYNSSNTVDGFWGGRELESFYNDQIEPFLLIIRSSDVAKGGAGDQYLVIIDDFSKTISKRGSYDFWNISMSFNEV